MENESLKKLVSDILINTNKRVDEAKRAIERSAEILRNIQEETKFIRQQMHLNDVKTAGDIRILFESLEALGQRHMTLVKTVNGIRVGVALEADSKSIAPPVWRPTVTSYDKVPATGPNLGVCRTAPKRYEIPEPTKSNKKIRKARKTQSRQRKRSGSKGRTQ